MKLVKPEHVYHLNGGGIARIVLKYIPSMGVVGNLIRDKNGNWAFHYARTDLLHTDVLQEVVDILKTANSRTAPPTGYYRCVGCGSLFKIQEVPYESQCACEHTSCDGQVFCNEYKGWLYK